MPTQAELRHKLSSLSSTCTDSASQDTEAGDDNDEDDDDDVEEDEEEEEELQGAASLSSARAANRTPRGRGGNRTVAMAPTGRLSVSHTVKNGGGDSTQPT